MQELPKPDEQAEAAALQTLFFVGVDQVLDIIDTALGNTVAGVYLFGSSIVGGLRAVPLSDTVARLCGTTNI